ncbi:hypothetical protein [Wansuia hejianensis]|uniref:Uncharacterized protein n=1 Tax=Wansuia hejianensis TaxID=2763667 RepID=A0A926IN44_9FIRM|nr:hypothetical protein [Wansuia hejianensis]MBC8590308.1 hypothetical protein [Wansuia hejianensis]
MGTDIIALLNQRDTVLDIVIDNFNTWDKSIESSIEILESNEKNLEKIKDINDSLTRLSTSDIFDEVYRGKIEVILTRQEGLIDFLMEEKGKVSNSIRQLNKKDQVVNNYISQNKESIFIDKDL